MAQEQKKTHVLQSKTKLDIGNALNFTLCQSDCSSVARGTVHPGPESDLPEEALKSESTARKTEFFSVFENMGHQN